MNNESAQSTGVGDVEVIRIVEWTGAFGPARELSVFVGDLLHSPVQILDPTCNSCFCLDAAQAAATRRRILERAADERELVVPAHFAGPGAVEVSRRDGSFTLGRRERW
ncbi:hypothetical protein AMK16_29840 [Streptomyces sp. CB00455]|nr:hypothetical protein AMK16_29840 [Streptomyces sp. CB00455]